jgi:hypothetical protein
MGKLRTDTEGVLESILCSTRPFLVRNSGIFLLYSPLLCCADQYSSSARICVSLSYSEFLNASLEKPLARRSGL